MNKTSKIVLSPLGHTWVLDLDGTILKHNGYILDGEDSLLPGAKEFLASLPKDDMIVFLTSRKEEFAEKTISFLKKQGISYHTIIFNAPYGERILVNDKKESGLETAKAINIRRNDIQGISVSIDHDL